MSSKERIAEARPSSARVVRPSESGGRSSERAAAKGAPQKSRFPSKASASDIGRGRRPTASSRVHHPITVSQRATRSSGRTPARSAGRRRSGRRGLYRPAQRRLAQLDFDARGRREGRQQCRPKFEKEGEGVVSLGVKAGSGRECDGKWARRAVDVDACAPCSQLAVGPIASVSRLA